MYLWSMHIFLCIYYQLSESDNTVIASLTRFKAANNQPMIVVGDFNVYHQDWLCNTHTCTTGRNFVSIMVYPNLLLSLLEVMPYWI